MKLEAIGGLKAEEGVEGRYCQCLLSFKKCRKKYGLFVSWNFGQTDNLHFQNRIKWPKLVFASTISNCKFGF